jgi:glycosyltransferase involved in cell wall biosynthesis
MQAKVTMVGHPFAPIGMGEHLRATFRALRSVGADVWVRDVWGVPGAQVPPGFEEFAGRLVDRLQSDISIFTLNGDERAPAFDRLGSELSSAGRTIVYPAWELPRYPEAWGRELEHYDELWSTSSYSGAAFRAAVRRPVTVLPLPCHPVLSRTYSRRHFGISETAYVFSYFFDLTSHIERKNPFALLDAVALVRAARPYTDFQVVLKLGSPHADPAAVARFREALGPHRQHAVLVDQVLDNAEVKSLVRLSDAFVSLHRAEGFGFGPGEAMYFGKPVVATGYSGNMEYMTPETALLVDYTLIPVAEGQYPHAAGQVWADPDVEQAAACMIKLLDDPDGGRALGARASAHVRTHFSLRACGLRYGARLANPGT